MLPQLYAWREELTTLSTNIKNLEVWLFLGASKVLFGGKPGELLLMRDEKNFGPSLEEQKIRCVKRLMEWGLSLFILRRERKGLSVVVYDRKRVNDVLRRVSGTPFWARAGYASRLTAEEFFDQVSRRWSVQGEFPHEIAVALGYPLKDVVGFMQMSPIQYTGTYGWRVYGEKDSSLLLRDGFARAKNTALNFLGCADDGSRYLFTRDYGMGESDTSVDCSTASGAYH